MATAKKSAKGKATAKPAKKKTVAAKKPVAKPKSKKVVASKKIVKKPAVKKTRVTKKPVAKKPIAAPKKVAKKKIAPAKKLVAVKKAVKKIIPVKKAVVRKKPTAKTAELGLIAIAPYKEAKGEEYMNPRQEAHFSQILNAWKFDLMREVDRTKTHMQDEAANFPDPNDRASQEEEFNLELRTRDRERKLIKKIEETIERITNHDYGYCDACGIEIGIRRLEARPTANLCIDCKTLDEMKERAG